MFKLTNGLFLILMIVLVSSCGEEVRGTSGQEAFILSAGTETFEYRDVPGLSKAERKEGGKILLEGDLLNGSRHGSWVSYDDKGVVTSLETYFEGKKQGVSLTFDKQGYIKTKAYYHNDQLDGEFKSYKRNKVVEERSYRNGRLEGLVKKYYDNGKPMEEAPFIDGRLDGIAKWYDQEGNLSIAYRYENGELVDKNPKLNVD